MINLVFVALDLPSALQAMSETVELLSQLPPQWARRLATRCREVGLELAELNHSGVSAVVERLHPWEPEDFATDDQI
jgi:hypothetical protein